MFCKYIQWRLEDCLENRIPPEENLLGHLQKCPDCRQYYQQICRITLLLRSGNPDLLKFDEKALKKKILSRLSIVRPNFSKPSGRFARPISAAVAVAAILLFGVGIWMLLHIQPPGSLSLTPVDLVRFNQLISSERIPLQSRLIQQSIHQPFEKEFDNMAQDMQNALAFLSACLPQSAGGKLE